VYYKTTIQNEITLTFNSKDKRRKKSAGIDLTPILIILGVIEILLTLYIGYRATISDKKLFSVSLFALFAGLLFESIRVSESWKTVLGIFTVAYLFSLAVFLPGKSDTVYNFENYIEIWPYAFLIIFAIFFGIAYKERITAKMNEGFALVLSLSFVYWIIDHGFTNFHNWFASILILISFSMIVFSIINAFTNLNLSKTTRLMLSIWSTAILFGFAIDNIIRVFNNPEIESTYISNGLYIGLQFFLLGMSAVYIIQNFMLITVILPSKNDNFKLNVKDHLDRFSNEQVLTRHSLFCVFYTLTFYGLNYKYQFLPRHTIIWLVIVTFPFFLRFIDFILKERKNIG